MKSSPLVHVLAKVEESFAHQFDNTIDFDIVKEESVDKDQSDTSNLSIERSNYYLNSIDKFEFLSMKVDRLKSEENLAMN